MQWEATEEYINFFRPGCDLFWALESGSQLPAHIFQLVLSKDSEVRACMFYFLIYPTSMHHPTQVFYEKFLIYNFQLHKIENLQFRLQFLLLGRDVHWMNP